MNIFIFWGAAVRAVSQERCSQLHVRRAVSRRLLGKKTHMQQKTCFESDIHPECGEAALFTGGCVRWIISCEDRGEASL